MSSSSDSRPHLSAENADRLNEALLLSRELQTHTHDADGKLSRLRGLLDQCREGVRRQNPNRRRSRLEAINQARNYLHFLPNLQHPQATGRLRSIGRRLQLAMRQA